MTRVQFGATTIVDLTGIPPEKDKAFRKDLTSLRTAQEEKGHRDSFKNLNETHGKRVVYQSKEGPDGVAKEIARILKKHGLAFLQVQEDIKPIDAAEIYDEWSAARMKMAADPSRADLEDATKAVKTRYTLLESNSSVIMPPEATGTTAETNAPQPRGSTSESPPLTFRGKIAHFFKKIGQLFQRISRRLTQYFKA